VRATLREDSPARCNTLNRQVHNRVCSVFVIRDSVSKTSTYEDALLEKDLNQTSEPGVSTLSRDFRFFFVSD
jgi:hypothetical protein